MCSGGGGEAASPKVREETKEERREEERVGREGEGQPKRLQGTALGCFKGKSKAGPTRIFSTSFETKHFASRTSVNARYVSRTPNEANE